MTVDRVYSYVGDWSDICFTNWPRAVTWVTRMGERLAIETRGGRFECCNFEHEPPPFYVSEGDAVVWVATGIKPGDTFCPHCGERVSVGDLNGQLDDDEDLL